MFGAVTTTGESDTVFAFGTTLGPGLGQMVLRNGRVLGYDNPRERGYRIDGDFVELLDEAGHATSRMQRMAGPLPTYVGQSTDSAVGLYLIGIVQVDQTPGALQHRVLVNTVPKSGTYWLREAFVQLGYRPTDLHLGGRNLIVDNRGLEDEQIHWDIYDRLTETDLSLLPWILPPGSVTVSHIDDPELLRRLRERGMTVVNVTRGLEDVLVSIFRFKRDRVAPRSGENWRSASDVRSQFLGFLATYGSSDVDEIRRYIATIRQLQDMPCLQYEDLRRGEISTSQRRALEQALGSRDLVRRLMASLASTKDKPTSTLTTSPQEPEVRVLVRELLRVFPGESH